MTETVKPSPEYLKAFNQGYVIERELPELSSQLFEIQPDSDRSQGFLDGKKQAFIEKMLEKDSLKSRYYSPEEPSRDLDKDNSIDKDY